MSEPVALQFVQGDVLVGPVGHLDHGPVMVFDVTARKQEAHVDAVVGGSSILVAPDGLHAYVDVTDKDTLYVIDLTQKEIVRELHSGEGPNGWGWVQAR